MSEWINFKELRASLNFEEVLRYYKVEVKRKNNQHHGFCPLPSHNGKRNSPSFSANLERGIFKCFGCGAMGNLLEFAALMERIDSTNGTKFREFALEMRRRFCPGAGEKLRSREEEPQMARHAKLAGPSVSIVNAPLDFELQGLDFNHPYLKSRGFSSATISHFGVGFCSRGILKNRIAIPLRSHMGALVGYAGRVVDDRTISETNPRYCFPSKRERGGKLFEFRKTQFLYNGFALKPPVSDLIIVEGFASVWWLHQNGLSNVVATMGADFARRQGELILSVVAPSDRVWFLSDEAIGLNDDLGCTVSRSKGSELVKERPGAEFGHGEFGCPFCSQMKRRLNVHYFKFMPQGEVTHPRTPI
jgi:DNA primase